MLGKASGVGLEYGVFQPAVSTCFTFTSLLSKVGYFWLFVLEKVPLWWTCAFMEVRASNLELHLGQAAIIRVSCEIKLTFFHFFVT
jgi:hypothetical protein